jgi:hypothetical protein
MSHSIKQFNQTQLEFMEACGQFKLPLADAVKNLFSNKMRSAISLWMSLIDEETRVELRTNLLDRILSSYTPESDAERLEILTLIADDIADSIYVLCGLGNCLGIPTEKVFAAVHEANMSKAIPIYDDAGGNPHTIIGYRVERRPDGKIMKPEGWKPANIKAILAEEFAKTLAFRHPVELASEDAPGT